MCVSNFFVLVLTSSYIKQKQNKECNSNVHIFCFNLIPNTIGLLFLKKTLRTLYHSSKRIFVFVSFVVLFKEFCSLYFHDKANQRNIVLVLFRVANVIHALKL